MKYFSLLIVITLFFLMVCCSSGGKNRSPFRITETDQKIELKEDTNTVFIYQKKPKTRNGDYLCNNYIHPLYNLNGDVMTEEFPPDHPYHRGVFWAWHQLYADGKRLGDGWTNDSIAQDVMKVNYKNRKEQVQFKIDVSWRSLVYGNGQPFMYEKTVITVHKADSSLRKIDFDIRLTAAVPNLQIGGSADQKGYGGFCVRMRTPSGLIFTSANGPVTPQDLQIKAGPWMDFSGMFDIAPRISGITILCHPSMPDYPEPWILRQKGSMQNVVFPGRERIDVPMNKSVVLRYRLIIHNGGAGSLNIPQLQEEYARTESN
jgi:hypothetical protein